MSSANEVATAACSSSCTRRPRAGRALQDMADIMDRPRRPGPRAHLAWPANLPPGHPRGRRDGRSAPAPRSCMAQPPDAVLADRLPARLLQKPPYLILGQGVEMKPQCGRGRAEPAEHRPRRRDGGLTASTSSTIRYLPAGENGAGAAEDATPRLVVCRRIRLHGLRRGPRMGHVHAASLASRRPGETARSSWWRGESGCTRGRSPGCPPPLREPLHSRWRRLADRAPRPALAARPCGTTMLPHSASTGFTPLCPMRSSHSTWTWRRCPTPKMRRLPPGAATVGR